MDEHILIANILIKIERRSLKILNENSVPIKYAIRNKKNCIKYIKNSSVYLKMHRRGIWSNIHIMQ